MQVLIWCYCSIVVNASEREKILPCPKKVRTQFWGHSLSSYLKIALGRLNYWKASVGSFWVDQRGDKLYLSSKTWFKGQQLVTNFSYIAVQFLNSDVGIIFRASTGLIFTLEGRFLYCFNPNLARSVFAACRNGLRHFELIQYCRGAVMQLTSLCLTCVYAI